MGSLKLSQYKRAQKGQNHTQHSQRKTNMKSLTNLFTLKLPNMFEKWVQGDEPRCKFIQGGKGQKNCCEVAIRS